MEIETALQQISDLQRDHELFIHKLSEPLLQQMEHAESQAGNRNSDASSAVDVAAGNSTPASLELDLAHYKELFTKLRFSYIEQTTKEKFLRAIVDDPPIYVTAAENLALESHLSSVKANLKAQKQEVADLVTAIEGQSRELSRRHQDIEAQTERLRALPAETAILGKEIEILRAAQTPQSENPVMNLPLPRVLELIKQRKAEVAELDSRLLEYENKVEQKDIQLRQLQEELRPLEKQRASTEAAASDAKIRRDEGVGGAGDDLEERGRWLRGVETTLRNILHDGD